MIEHEDRVQSALNHYVQTLDSRLPIPERAHYLVVVFDEFGVVCSGCGGKFLGIVGERIVQLWDKELWYFDRETAQRLEVPIEEQGPTRLYHGPCAPREDRINHHFRGDDVRAEAVRIS